VQSEHILHRDLKPANMLLALEGSARVVLRLADFGSAVTICPGAASLADGGFTGTSREASADNMQELTSRVCTVPYAAPEILLGSTKPAPISLSSGPRVYICASQTHCRVCKPSRRRILTRQAKTA